MAAHANSCPPLTVRAFREGCDSIPELTGLIHRAYKQLSEMDLRYWATYQSDEDTLRRARRGETWFAELDGRIVGTITLTPHDWKEGWTHPWYERTDVAKFGQFAVEPGLQGKGVGSRLMEHIETRARELGAAELALDTSDQAHHLIALYLRRGYRIVGKADWRPKVNYESVIMSKGLIAPVMGT